MYLRFIYLVYHIMTVPCNALLYLALIRPVFSTGAIVKQNWNKVCKNKGSGSRFSGFCRVPKDSHWVTGSWFSGFSGVLSPSFPFFVESHRVPGPHFPVCQSITWFTLMITLHCQVVALLKMNSFHCRSLYFANKAYFDSI